MPVQEPGIKRARPLPCQPGAGLAGFTADGGAVSARLALSNNAPFASRASHFAVYDNLATASALADYPAGFPGQFTVAGSASGAAATTVVCFPVGAGPGYDITVTGPNRFLRRFTGDRGAPGASARVTASYYRQGGEPTLTLTLANHGPAEMTFTVTACAYSTGEPVTYQVPAGGCADHCVDPVRDSGGWYDLAVTIDSDHAWSQRFTGHVETGAPSVTG
jgi:phospholipase C